MSDTAYGDIMEAKQDEGWSFFEEKSVMERFKDLYIENKKMKEMIDHLFKQIDTYKRKQECLLGKDWNKAYCEFQNEATQKMYDTSLPKSSAEPKGSVEDSVKYVDIKHPTIPE